MGIKIKMSQVQRLVVRQALQQGRARVRAIAFAGAIERHNLRDTKFKQGCERWAAGWLPLKSRRQEMVGGSADKLIDCDRADRHAPDR